MLAAKPKAAKLMITIKATGKAAWIPLLDLHFTNRVAVQENHEKPMREGSFSNYCQALEEPLKGVGDSAALGQDWLAHLPGRPQQEGEWPPLGGGRAELG